MMKKLLFEVDNREFYDDGTYNSDGPHINRVQDCNLFSWHVKDGLVYGQVKSGHMRPVWLLSSNIQQAYQAYLARLITG